MAQEKFEEQTGEIQLLNIDPIVVLRDVAKRWYVILAAVILVSMGAYVVSDVTYRPDYTTTTTFVVSSRGSSATVYQNLSAATNLATVFSEVLNSSILRGAVMEQLGMTSFDGTIQASAVAETNLLTMKVTAHDPRTAFLMTRAIIENHHIVSHQVMGDTVLEVLQNPTVPTVPSNLRNSGSMMKKAALLCAAAMCALLAALSYMKDTVRSKQEAERKLDCRFLGELRHERKVKNLSMLLKRQKSSVLITNPATSFTFAETVRKLRRRVEQHMPEEGKVLMVTSVLENEGKSTIAVNLAIALAQKQKKVLLLDCDLRKPACHKILEQSWRGSGTADVIRGKAKLSESTVQIGRNKYLHGLLEQRGMRSSTEIVGSEGLHRLITEAAAQYDYVIVDTPPMSVAPDAECVMELVDATLLVVRQNTCPAKEINAALDTLHMAKAKLLGCVLNNVYSSFLSDQSGYSRGYGYDRYGHYGRYGKYGTYRPARVQTSKVERTDHE